MVATLELRARTLHRVAGVHIFFYDLMPPLSKSIEPSVSLYTLDAKRAA
jgi:hypothetical protein